MREKGRKRQIEAREREEMTKGVYPLIGSHMSRDLISRYLRPYLSPIGGPIYLSFSLLSRLFLCLFFISRTRGVADNEMERNANRIAPASEIH